MTPTNKVPITNEYGVHKGYVHVGGRLPTFIMIDGDLYQRYGLVSDYRYVYEPNVWEPAAHEVSID